MRMIDADALIEFCAERWIPLNIDAVNMQPTIQPEKAQLSHEGTTSDLISRQAAIDALARMMPRSYTPDGSHPADEEIFRAQEVFVDCIEALKILPSAQSEPQEGHWIWVVGDLECSKCHTRYPDLYPDYDNSVACPHCGARMKGEQNETD